MSGSAPATPTDQHAELLTIRGLIAGHKWAALVAAALCAVIVAMILVAVLGAKAGPVTDSTLCTQWGSANQDQQNAYARFYLKEHGPTRGSGSSPAAGVINAINNGCLQAFNDGVDDSTTVVQAISGNF